MRRLGRERTLERMKPLLITIDGPGGAGKTTVSRKVAQRLGYTYVDTGALYRAVALAVSQRDWGAEVDDDDLAGLLRGLHLEYRNKEGGSILLLDGEDISEAIRTPAMTMLASSLSAKKVVRDHLLGVQRQMAGEGGVIFEGRDMGTVVFPMADVKFFLSADLEVRAERRHKELLAKGEAVDLEAVSADMARRDRNDSNRSLAPLKAAADAIPIDSTPLSEDEVVDRILHHIGKAPA